MDLNKIEIDVLRKNGLNIISLKQVDKISIHVYTDAELAVLLNYFKEEHGDKSQNN